MMRRKAGRDTTSELEEDSAPEQGRREGRFSGEKEFDVADVEKKGRNRRRRSGRAFGKGIWRTHAEERKETLIEKTFFDKTGSASFFFEGGKGPMRWSAAEEVIVLRKESWGGRGSYLSLKKEY